MTAHSIRDQLAAKRAEVQKSGGAIGQPGRAGLRLDQPRGEELADKSVSGQVKRAAKSGKLDIAGLGLDKVPVEVYSVLLGVSKLARPATPPQDGVRDVTRSLNSLNTGGTRSEDVWVECEEQIGFKLSDNRIAELDVEIGGFGGLKTIDLRNNLLTRLPDSFADLLRLVNIDLSHNSLTVMPPQVLLLPALVTLDLSHNKIESLNMNQPVEPSEEALGYGAGFLSTSFTRNKQKNTTILPVLTTLNLGYNLLTNDSLSPLGQARKLKTLNLESNKLDGRLDVTSIGIDKSSLKELSVLNLSGNPSLDGPLGDLDGVDVSLEGCGYGAQQATAAAGRGESSQAAASAAPTRPSKPGLPVPNPSMTMVYRTTAAATFDAEPLKIDFDIYLPSTPAGPSGHPLVIWFHGGGLLQGNKENLPPHLRRLPNVPLTKGGKEEHIAVISPNYRLAPQVPILDILSDVTVLLDFVRTKLNEALKEEGEGDHLVDLSRICVSGGSAGGYLALIAGMAVPPRATDESVGGYKGEHGIKCIAPFYPITDLEDKFWATKTDPVPWWGSHVPDEAARPHLDLKAAPVCTAVSGGPRSILYPYMLQYALFPSLLFMKQRSVGHGTESFRPDAHTLSLKTRMETATNDGVKQIPMLFVYGTIDDKVQPMDTTLDCLTRYNGDIQIWKVEGGDHGFDEDPGEECEELREWLSRKLL